MLVYRFLFFIQLKALLTYETWQFRFALIWHNYFLRAAEDIWYINSQ